MENFDYDVLVIGAGIAGIGVARQLASAGKSVALAEKRQYLGGECVNYSGAPTQSLFRSAKVYRSLNQIDNLGLYTTGELDYAMVKAQKDYIAGQMRMNFADAEALAEAGIDVIRGEAKFIDQNTVLVAGKEITAGDIVIATGAKNKIPAIAGLEKVPYLTSQTIIDLAALPESTLIIGAGPVGVEFACMLASFGVDVTLLEYGSRILPQEEPEVADEVLRSLEDQGVAVVVDFKPEKVDGDAEHIALFGVGRQGEIDFSAQKILLATGKIPNIDNLDLEKAGIKIDKGIFKLNKYLKIAKKNIWVAGDASGQMGFARTAKYEADLVTKNMLGAKVPYDFRVVPRVIWCRPEVASVGELEQNIKNPIVGMARIEKLPSAIVDGQKYGFVKIIADKKSGEILGASIACPSAGEMINELVVAMRARLNVRDIADTIHTLSTYSEAIQIAGRDAVSQLQK